MSWNRGGGYLFGFHPSTLSPLSIPKYLQVCAKTLQWVRPLLLASQPDSDHRPLTGWSTSCFPQGCPGFSKASLHCGTPFSSLLPGLTRRALGKDLFLWPQWILPTHSGHCSGRLCPNLSPGRSLVLKHARKTLTAPKAAGLRAHGRQKNKVRRD